MRLSTAENHVTRITRSVERVYRSAIHHRPDSPTLWQQVRKVTYNDSAWNRLPEWAQSKIVASWINLRQRLIRDYTIQLYKLPDGRKVLSSNAWEAMGEEAREQVRNGSKFHLKTYWLQEESTCANDGTVTIIRKPTDDVYWEDGMYKV